MKILAVIPARAGSKGVPNKNIAPLAGLPLIAWSIRAAQNAPSIDRIVVSTDGAEIARVAQEHGAEVPFMRPAELALDTTPGAPPLLHALDWLAQNESYRPDYVLLLQPTSPLRTSEDIEAAASIARAQDANSVIGVTPASRHPYWMKKILPDGRLDHFLNTEYTKTRRQDLPPAYDVNGAIYLIRPEAFRTSESWYPERTFPHVMPNERSLDIDTPWDLKLADLILRSSGRVS